MKNNDLLLEIGCEELPKDNMTRIVARLADSLSQQLLGAHLSHDTIQTFITPRRIALLVPKLDAMQPSQTIDRQGPSIENAFDKHGTPTIACLGFAKSCGVSVDQLKVVKTDKGERVFCKVDKPGAATESIIADLINEALAKMPMPISMRWNNKDLQFIRPVHWVVLLFGDKIIPATILGQTTSNKTYGHRFHHPQAITLTNAKSYSETLAMKGCVLADFKLRQQRIRNQIVQLSKNHHKPIINEALLEEVTALVEWPVVLKGSFRPEFLALPKEVLTTSMATHQKCFPIEDEFGNLTDEFVLVANIESKNPKVVIEGNQRVINARLSDASFFYKNDRKIPLIDRLERLKTVVFQKQLGTIADKVTRIAKLAKFIATKIGADPQKTVLTASLAKGDLVSEMVYEFPNLQGIMGYYYAQKDHVAEECALAIKEHYYPRFSGDQLPQNLIGAAVALADRLDTLVGIFGINLIPTGDKDPFALRRQALGILRILIEKNLSLDLMELLHEAKAQYDFALENKTVIDQTYQFLMSRLKAWYQEGGIHSDVFEAVFANNPTIPLDFHHRILAVQQFLALPEAHALAAANKRVSNILKKAPQGLPERPDAKLYEEEAEQKLAEKLIAHQKTADHYYQNSDYTKALTDLSTLKDPIDQFFDKVMVMTDQEKTRNNRLALLTSLRRLFTQVADISLLG